MAPAVLALLYPCLLHGEVIEKGESHSGSDTPPYPRCRPPKAKSQRERHPLMKYSPISMVRIREGKENDEVQQPVVCARHHGKGYTACPRLRNLRAAQSLTEGEAPTETPSEKPMRCLAGLGVL